MQHAVAEPLSRALHLQEIGEAVLPDRADASGVWRLVYDLLDTRSCPSMLVDSSCRVWASNSAAIQIMERFDDWSISSGEKLTYIDDCITAELRREISRFLSMPRERKTVFKFDKQNGIMGLVGITHVRFPKSHECRSVNAGYSLALVSIKCGARSLSNIDYKILDRAFSFTPTEARLAFALMDGMSLQEFADQSGSAITTVRWHLRNALSKTGCSRQRELVSLLMALID